MDAPASLRGQYLLAMPGIGDPRFEKAVIAMCAHDEQGALGVGVGQILPGITLHRLFEQLSIEPGIAPDCGIHVGGPVEPQRGFVLHGTDWAGGDTLLVDASNRGSMPADRIARSHRRAASLSNRMLSSPRVASQPWRRISPSSCPSPQPA